MAQSRTSARPRVVVVGGSFAGLCTARHLKSSCDVVVVEPRDYFEYTPGALHLLAGSGAFSALLTPLSTVARGCRHEQGWFAGIKPDGRRAVVRRMTASGEEELHELEFDALVLCNGVPYQAPIRASRAATSMAARIKELQTQKRLVDASKHIVIVGGGLVGVELAAEFAVRLGHKPRITLLSRSDLLNTLPPRAGRLATDWLQSHNIDVLVGDEVGQHSPEAQTLVTKAGRSIPVDLLMDCTGVAPRAAVGGAAAPAAAAPAAAAAAAATAAEAGASLSSGDAVWPFTKDGLAVVGESLELTESSNCGQGVFAAGDVIEHAAPGVGFAVSTERGGLFGTLSRRPTVRNAHLAESQAELCAANVRRFLAASAASSASSVAVAPPSYLHYPRDVFGTSVNPLLSCVSLGPRHAIVVFNGIVLGGTLLGLLAALVKFVIERSKISEIRQEPFGRAFWAFGHVVVNATHGVWVWAVQSWLRLRGGRGREAVAGAVSS